MTEMENEFNQTRSDLKNLAGGMEEISLRVTEMENEFKQTRSDLELKEDELKSLSLRLDLKQKQDEVESFFQRLREVEEEFKKMRSVLKQREEEMEKFIWRMREMEGQLRQTRSDLKHREDQVKSLSQRMGEKGEELEKTRYDLKQREEEVESLKQRVTEMERSHQQQNQDLRVTEMENEFKQTRSDLELKEDELKSLSLRLDLKQKQDEVESFFQRSALKEKDKELQSFKDRVAEDVALSMKTGITFESMNSPVNRARLKEMYDELWRQWHKIKKDLGSNQERPEFVKEMIQEKFKSAMLDMEKKKHQIDEVFGLDEASRGSAYDKVQQYRESTCQNLQLVLYQGRKEDANLKTPSSGHEGGKPQDVMETWSSNCYRLGCLMALNNPPLHPDWENHPRSMDEWDLLPQSITSVK